jgi:hypothetical protein
MSVLKETINSEMILLQISRVTANILDVDGSFNFLQRVDRPNELDEVGDTYWLIGRCGNGGDDRGDHDDDEGDEDHSRGRSQKKAARKKSARSIIG